MTQASIELILRTLNEAGVRYLVAGGLAVVAHGYLRFTADLDLILDLERGNLIKAVTALKSLGYRPRAPVTLEAFCEEHNRQDWMRDKGMKVFSLHSPQHAATEIDLFVELPLPMDEAVAAGLQVELSPGVLAHVLGLEHLLQLKRAAGRPKDLEDVRQLTRLKETEDDS
jgi:predicted nucleotidyltransferase